MELGDGEYVEIVCKIGEIMMDELMEILEEMKPDVDFKTCNTLIDDGILDSFDILNLVSELNDAFDIEITPVDIVPDNFNSAEALWKMVKRLQED